LSDVFDITEQSSASDFFRDAALDAAYDLAVFDVLHMAPLPAEGKWTVDALARGLGVEAGKRRLRLLLDALVGYGILARDGTDDDAYDGYKVAEVRPRPEAPTFKMFGWGAIAEVIRRNQPLPPGGDDGVVRMHLHLAKAGALAAEETAQLLGASRVQAKYLVDLGGGAGAYTAAFLSAFADARATLVDFPEVISLAQQHLAGFAGRVDFITSDIRDAAISNASVALLANVLHLHGPELCAHLCKLAAGVVAPGGIVAIKDLRMDTDPTGVRTGPLQSLLFALNMGIYTQDGDVYETALLREWLAGAGLVDIEERRLAASPNAIVVLGRKP